jgi:glutathione peroxidase-family protein
MKNLIVEKTEVKLDEEEKINSFIENSKSDEGVIIKIKNNVYRHLIDKDGKCFIKNITPIFEFDSYDELETILKTQI